MVWARKHAKEQCSTPARQWCSATVYNRQWIRWICGGDWRCVLQGFYLPGVAPRAFKDGEAVQMKVQTLVSTETPLQVIPPQAWLLTCTAPVMMHRASLPVLPTSHFLKRIFAFPHDACIMFLST